MDEIEGLVRELVERGGCDPIVAGAVLVKAAKALGATRSSTNAERQAAYRARQKCVTESNERCNVVTPVTDCSISSSTLTESKIQKESKKERKGSPRGGTKLPPDWSPSPDHFLLAHKLGLSDAAVLEEAAAMRDWAAANANRSITTKADWDRTFAGWLRRIASKRREYAKTINPDPNSWQASRDRARAAYAKLGEAVRSAVNGGNGCGPPTLRLVSDA